MPRIFGKAKQTRLSLYPAEPPSELKQSPKYALGSTEGKRYVLRSSCRRQMRLDNYISEQAATRLSRSSSPATRSDQRQDPPKLPLDAFELFQTQVIEGRKDRDSMLPEPTLPPNNHDKILDTTSSDEDIRVPTRQQRTSKGVVIDIEDKNDLHHTPRKLQVGDESEVLGQGGTHQTPQTRRLRSRYVDNSGSDHHVASETRSFPKTRSATARERISESPMLLTNVKNTRSSVMRLSGLGSSETSDVDELVTRPTTRKRRHHSLHAAFVADDQSMGSEDDFIFSSPIKRRRHDSVPKTPCTPQRASKQDKLDLEEDLLALQDSALTNTRTRGRLVESSRSKKQKQLEILRRRRAGKRIAGPAGSDANSGGSEHSELSSDKRDSDSASLPKGEDSDVEPDIRPNEDLDRYDDDFVLEDSGGELGVPGDDIEVPYEFTSNIYKEAKEYFQDVVEWMVHNKLNPAFPRSDKKYQFAVMKLSDEVKGRTGSQLISTVWTADFNRALKGRPQVEVLPIPITDFHFCDACNRSGHPTPFEIKFSGQPYSDETLEPLSDDDGDARSDSEGRKDRDRDGHSILSKRTWFRLGRHCKNKAVMAHSLIHWRFHLNEWVVGFLERKGAFVDREIIRRSRLTQKQLTRYADKVMDSMVEAGEIWNLWRDFRRALKTVREKESGW